MTDILESKYKLYNFRPIHPERTLENCNAFRSASLDSTNTDTVKYVKEKYNIRCIVDLRQKTEHELSLKKSGNPVDEFYTTLYIKNRNNMKVASVPPSPNHDASYKRYFVNFMSVKHYMVTFFRLTWFQRLFSFYLIFRFMLFRDMRILKYACEVQVGPAGLYNQCITMLSTCKPGIANAFYLMTKEENFPLVLSCEFGKDRTGIIVALLLDFLSVSREEIARSYAESEENLKPKIDKVEKFFFDNGLTKEFAHAVPETMLQILDHIQQEYGGGRKYLLSLGFSEEELQKIKENIMRGHVS